MSLNFVLQKYEELEIFKKSYLNVFYFHNFNFSSITYLIFKSSKIEEFYIRILSHLRVNNFK